MWIDSKGTLTSEQQQFDSTLKAAPYTSSGKDVIYVPRYHERRKSRVHAPIQVNDPQPSAAKGQTVNGGLVEVPQSSMAMDTSSDESIDCMQREEFNVEEALHVAEREVQRDMDSGSIWIELILLKLKTEN